GSVNLSTYAVNSPTNYSDPSGLFIPFVAYEALFYGGAILAVAGPRFAMAVGNFLSSPLGAAAVGVFNSYVPQTAPRFQNVLNPSTTYYVQTSLSLADKDKLAAIGEVASGLTDVVFVALGDLGQWTDLLGKTVNDLIISGYYYLKIEGQKILVAVVN